MAIYEYIKGNSWQKQIYKEAALDFIEKMNEEQLYPAYYIWDAIKCWHCYADDELPDIKKSRSVAAALEYLTAKKQIQDSYFEQEGVPSRAEVAEKYNTTASTISKYEKILEEYQESLEV